MFLPIDSFVVGKFTCQYFILFHRRIFRQYYRLILSSVISVAFWRISSSEYQDTLLYLLSLWVKPYYCFV